MIRHISLTIKGKNSVPPTLNFPLKKIVSPPTLKDSMHFYHQFLHLYSVSLFVSLIQNSYEILILMVHASKFTRCLCAIQSNVYSFYSSMALSFLKKLLWGYSHTTGGTNLYILGTEPSLLIVLLAFGRHRRH